MKLFPRLFLAAAFAVALAAATVSNVRAARGPAPSPSPSASAPAALPTATPEPPDVAVPRLESKIKADPNDKDSLQELAGYYLGLGKPEQALALTQRLISLGAKTAQVYYLDGVANQAIGRIPQATADFEEASNREPTNSQILLTLTNLYLQTGRGADAERVAKRATTFNATDKRVFENYGLVLGQEGKYDEARTQFENAAKLDPKDPLPIVLEARSYVSQRALALAAQDFDRALAIDPNDADALLGKATLEANDHQVAAAIATYEKLLSVETSDEAKAGVLVQEYTTYRDEKMMDQALATLKRAQQLYPNSPAVHIAYGDYDAAFAKDMNAAEREWTAALGPNRDNPDALERLGQLALSRNRTSDAMNDFRRLAQVQPGDPRAQMTLGELQAQQRQFSDARASFARSFQLQQTPQALAGLGSVDFQLHNYKECSQAFGAIDRGAPAVYKSQPQLLYIYAKCLQSDRQDALAKATFTRFKPYVKPGTPLAKEVAQSIAQLSGPSKPAAAKPKPTATPKAH